MERRNWSLKALNELIYAHSLDSFEKADALTKWNEEYLQNNNSIESFDLEIKDLKHLEELFFKTINFFKKHKEYTRRELLKIQKMQKFLDN